MIGDAAADDTAVIDHSRGIFGEQALSRCVNTATEDTPLAAVRVTANGQLDIGRADMRDVVFGVMAKKDTKSVLTLKARKRVGVGGVFFCRSSPR